MLGSPNLENYIIYKKKGKLKLSKTNKIIIKHIKKLKN